MMIAMIPITTSNSTREKALRRMAGSFTLSDGPPNGVLRFRQTDFKVLLFAARRNIKAFLI